MKIDQNWIETKNAVSSKYSILDNTIQSLEEEFLFFLSLKIGEDTTKQYAETHNLPNAILMTSICCAIEEVFFKKVKTLESIEVSDTQKKAEVILDLLQEWRKCKKDLLEATNTNTPEVFQKPNFKDNMTNDEIVMECVKQVCYPLAHSFFKERK